MGVWAIGGANGIFDIWIFLTFRIQVVNYLCQQGVSQNFCGRGGPLSHLVYRKMNPSKILDSDVNTFERRAEMFRYVLEFFYFIQPGYFLHNIGTLLVAFLRNLK